MLYTEKLKKIEEEKAEAIKKFEEEKNKLLEKRERAILKIIRDSQVYDFDDRLLGAFLKFIGNKDNLNNPFIKQLSQLSQSKSKTPSRTSKEVEPA
jgi:hypothetical protein